MTIAAIKILTALCAVFLGAPARFPNAAANYLFYVIEVVVFSACSVVILFGVSRDSRAMHLGVFFLLAAASFTNGLIPSIPAPQSFPGFALDLLVSIRLFSIVPIFLWLFAQEFPNILVHRSNRYCRWGYLTSVWVGIVLFAINLLLGPGLDLWGVGAPAWMLLFAHQPGSLYSGLIWPLLLLALVVLIWRGLGSRKGKRRIWIFAVILAIGFVPPFFLSLLANRIPAVGAFLAGQPGGSFLELSYYLVAATPVAATWAVVVHEVFDIPFYIRRAIQYSLARGGAVLIILLPVVWLGSELYQVRDQSFTLTSLFEGSLPLLPLQAIGIAVLIYVFRRWVFTAIDRQFFREQYRADQVLANLADLLPQKLSARELTDRLRHDLEKALRPETMAILLLDSRAGLLRSSDGRCRPLAATGNSIRPGIHTVIADADGSNTTVSFDHTEGELSSSTSLVTILESAPRSLNVDPDHPDSPFASLNAADQAWVVDEQFVMLVPLSAHGKLVGVIALGEKKSELPYSHQDRAFLERGARAWANVLEERIQGETPTLGVTRATERELLENAPARVCPRCRQAEPPATIVCSACRMELDDENDAALPYMLGKFQLEAQVGAGGMGVVYRALDTTPDFTRRVVLKTLPPTSPLASYDLTSNAQLRAEGFRLAQLGHRNLVTIFEATTWKGIPVLVFEYLEAGTVADKLRSGPLPYTDVLELGIAVADALDFIHSRSVLHRDVKPSNIGYTDAGEPQLIDFGLAEDIGNSGRGQTTRRGLDPDPDKTLTASTDARQGGGLAGTPRYLSPEAVNGGKPSASDDLWALAITLLESLAGRHPLAGVPGRELFRRISECRLPEIGSLLPDSPPQLVEFFDQALAKDISRRAASAKEFRKQLQALQNSLTTTAA